MFLYLKMALEARILSLLHLSNSEEQAKGLQSLVNEISQSKVATQTSEDLILIANKIFSFDESNQSQVSKALILALAKSLKSLDSLILHHVGSHVLQCLRDRPLVFDDADYVLRDTLFDYYIAGEEFSQAAQILGGVNLDSTVHLYSLNEKVDIYIKCAGKRYSLLSSFHYLYTYRPNSINIYAEAFLEDDATVDAEIFVNKASALINEVDDWTLQLRYRTTFARILDANRKFAEAASRYYELSTTSQHINRDDLLQLLGKAATCALLGKASSQRTRIIGLICKVSNK